MRVLFRTILLMALIFSFLGAVTVSSQTMRVAKVSDYHGDVNVLRGTQVIAAFTGMSLVEGDLIRTGKGSSAFLLLDDGSTLRIYEESLFQVSELKKSSVFQLWTGKVWVKVKKLLEIDSVFQVKTPNAVIGVRGTEFFVSYSAFEGTRSGVIEGKVAVMTAAMEISPDGEPVQTYRESILNPFEKVHVPVNGQPPRFERFGWGENDPRITGQQDQLLSPLPAGQPPLLPDNTIPGIQAPRGEIKPGGVEMPYDPAGPGIVIPEPVFPAIQAPTGETDFGDVGMPYDPAGAGIVMPEPDFPGIQLPTGEIDFGDVQLPTKPVDEGIEMPEQVFPGIQLPTEVILPAP